MIKSNFLTKLKKEGGLLLVDPSSNIAQSYLNKSRKCSIVAKLAFDADIYENAISEAYYSIYNTVTALFYRCGIKCENHSAAVIIIGQLFELQKLHEIFSEFKKDRIDNQYYTPLVGSEPVTKEQCSIRLKTAQRFNAELEGYMETLTLEKIKQLRTRFDQLK